MIIILATAILPQATSPALSSQSPAKRVSNQYFVRVYCVCVCLIDCIGKLKDFRATTKTRSEIVEDVGIIRESKAIKLPN